MSKSGQYVTTFSSQGRPGLVGVKAGRGVAPWLFHIACKATGITQRYVSKGDASRLGQAVWTLSELQTDIEIFLQRKILSEDCPNIAKALMCGILGKNIEEARPIFLKALERIYQEYY